MTDEEKQNLWDLITSATEKLGEHFDAIQILASMSEEDGTRTFFHGAGNWYARRGMAQEFVNVDQARTLAAEIER